MRQLAKDGFAAESRVRELEAQLESARAELAGIREEIEDTEVKAPIPGIVSDVFLNAGQFAPAGGQIIRIVDNSPLRVTLHVSQRDVGKVDRGSVALVSFATGGLAKGRVCFVAPAADPETRTFRVEVRVPNEDRRIPSRVSAELRVRTGEVKAHFISPAILALNEAGELGVKSVDENRKAAFHPVEILRAETDGVWIGGLPDRLQLISTGQGFVRQGESVRVANEEDARPAAASEAENPQGAPLPTSTVRSDPLDAAEELADPPPAEELCEGAGADAVSVGVAPSIGQAAGGASGQAVPQTGGAQPGVAGDTGAAPPVQSASPPSTGVTPPTIPSPPVAQPVAPAPAAPQGGAAASTPGAPAGSGTATGGTSGGAAQDAPQ